MDAQVAVTALGLTADASRSLPFGAFIQEAASGRTETPNVGFWAAALEEILLMDTAKSEVLEFLPK